MYHLLGVVAAANTITKVELPNDAVFSWYDVPSLIRRAFSGTKIAGFTLSGKDPDLIVVGKAIGQMNLFGDFHLQSKINEMLKPYILHPSPEPPVNPTPPNSNTMANLLSNTDELTKLSGVNISDTFNLTPEQSDELIGSLLGLIPIFILLLAFMIISVLYFSGYICGCCCCCCPWDYSFPNCCSNCAFIVGMIFIFLGGVFGCVSYVGLDHLVDRLQNVNATANEAFDSLDTSLHSMAEEVNSTYSPTLKSSTDQITTFIKWIVTTVKNFVATFKVAIYALLGTPDKKYTLDITRTSSTLPAGDIDVSTYTFTIPVVPNELLPLFTTGINWTQTAIILLLEDYIKGYVQEQTREQLLKQVPGIKEKFATTILTVFDSIDTLLKPIYDNVPQLDDLANQVEKQIPQTLGDDIYKLASPFITNLYPDYFAGFMTTINTDIRPMAETIGDYTDIKDLWVNVKQIYISLFFTIITMGIVFISIFYTHCCCSRCIVGINCCCPGIISCCCSCYGLLATILGFILVFVLQNVAPFCDSAINSIIDTGIPGRELTFPELSFQDLTQGYVKNTLLLPNITIPQIPLVSNLLHSTQGTGIADFFSLPKIINLPEYATTIEEFANDSYSSLDVPGTIEKYVEPVTSKWAQGDILPATLQGFAEKYLKDATTPDTPPSAEVLDVPPDYVQQYLDLPKQVCQTLQEAINKVHKEATAVPAAVERTTGATDHTKFQQNCESAVDYVINYNQQKNSNLDTTYTHTQISSIYITVYDKLNTAIGSGTNSKDANVVSLTTISVEVDTQLKAIIQKVVGFVSSLLGQLYNILNTFKADPIVTVTGIIINCVGYDLPLTLTYVSLSVHLVLLGQFISAITLCIRRMGMSSPPSSFHKRRESDSDDDSNESSDSSSSSSDSYRPQKHHSVHRGTTSRKPKSTRRHSTSSSSSSSRSFNQRTSNDSSSTRSSSSSGSSRAHKTRRLMGSSFQI